MMTIYLQTLLITLFAVFLSISYAEESGAGAMEEMDHSAHMGKIETTGTHEIDHAYGIKPEFELTDSEDSLVTQNDFLGKHVLLTFGFTHCAHICPVLSANIARTLEKNQASNAIGVFISVDTERDTAAITHEYANGFHRRMVGLSGSYEQVNTAANNFKVSYSVTKTQKHYTVQHTTNIYHIGPEGNLIGIYALNTSPEVMSTAMD